MSDPDDTHETDTPPRRTAPTPEELTNIFTEVTRQLDLPEVASARVFDDNMNGDADNEMSHTDSDLLAIMDAHVRAYLQAKVHIK